MKALPFKVPHGSKTSIKVDYDKIPHFYSTYHTHEELQLTMVIKGHGTAYIGDKILHFDEGDIYLLGQNLPHVFKDDMKDGDADIESISIFFLPTFLGEGFLSLPETRSIAKLILQTGRGIKINDDLQEEITRLIWLIQNSNGLTRLTTLVKILEQIAHESNITLITSPGYHKPKRSVDGQKINDVFDFMMANYNREIKLEEVADIAHMSSTAFCRYFKHHTRKTYSRYLNEIRIGQACKLLVDRSFSVSEVCYKSGFNNISNFNRQFKKITDFTPSEYQKHHR
ncbi:MAG: AraC family transcriptional regulator [Bacteroidota bacterium]